MNQPTKRSAFRKLAASLAVVTALGSLGTTALTEGVAHADAPANPVSLSNGVISYTGGPGIDAVTATLTNGIYKITNTRFDLTASSPCTRIAWGQVKCEATGVTGVRLDGKGDNDKLFGGPGNDVILGGPGVDSIFGRAGNDDLNGGDQMDELYGEEGDDTLDGGVGTAYLRTDSDGGDTMWGGDGIDRVTYVAKAGAVRVTLDTEPNDGLVASDERDYVHTDVENVTGSRYDDVLIGNDGPNKLYGTWGNDAIFGRGGADHLYGELGRDSLYGEGGDDFLYQRYATPLLPDVDAKTSCGDGFDTLYRDAGDLASPDCERINP